MAVFVDTGAWFAYFVRRDPDHADAVAWMPKNRQPLVTTDYVLDELLTLLKQRESYHVAVAGGDELWRERVARIEHIAVEDVAQAWHVFQRYHDKGWSFTDCTSKIVIERLRINQAFACDSHLSNLALSFEFRKKRYTLCPAMVYGALASALTSRQALIDPHCCFILATNALDDTHLPSPELLEGDPGQVHAERGGDC